MLIWNVPFGFDYDFQHLMPLRDLESHVFKSVVSLVVDISIALENSLKHPLILYLNLGFQCIWFMYFHTWFCGYCLLIIYQVCYVSCLLPKQTACILDTDLRCQIILVLSMRVLLNLSESLCISILTFVPDAHLSVLSYKHHCWICKMLTVFEADCLTARLMC